MLSAIYLILLLFLLLAVIPLAFALRGFPPLNPRTWLRGSAIHPAALERNRNTTINSSTVQIFDFHASGSVEEEWKVQARLFVYIWATMIAVVMGLLIISELLPLSAIRPTNKFVVLVLSVIFIPYSFFFTYKSTI